MVPDDCRNQYMGNLISSSIAIKWNPQKKILATMNEVILCWYGCRDLLGHCYTLPTIHLTNKKHNEEPQALVLMHNFHVFV